VKTVINITRASFAVIELLKREAFGGGENIKTTKSTKNTKRKKLKKV